MSGRLRPTAVAAAATASRQHELHIVIPGDLAWPARFDVLGHRAPLALWAKGKLDLLNASISEWVTVTGARASTGYGMTVTQDLAGQLAERRVQVVSGGALGVDTAAHQAALAAGGTTIAVIPSGLDRIYPSTNRDLHSRIAENGLLLSELPLSAPVSRRNFLA